MLPLDNSYIFGHFIRFHRKQTSLSQSELADLANVNIKVIKSLEAGKDTVQFNNIAKILKVLNVSLYAQSPLSNTDLKKRGFLLFPETAA